MRLRRRPRSFWQHMKHTRHVHQNVTKSPHTLGLLFHLTIWISSYNEKVWTMQSQNRNFHWVNHQMVENRVSGAFLDSKQPKANLQELSNLKFLTNYWRPAKTKVQLHHIDLKNFGTVLWCSGAPEGSMYIPHSPQIHNGDVTEVKQGYFIN